jgi:hypothetical protein
MFSLKVSVAQFEFGHSVLIFVTAAKSMHPALFKAIPLSVGQHSFFFILKGQHSFGS